MIAKAREINKAHTTFIDTILKLLIKEEYMLTSIQLDQIKVEQLQVDSLMLILIYNRYLQEIKN
jgi:hypothetical protein